MSGGTTIHPCSALPRNVNSSQYRLSGRAFLLLLYPPGDASANSISYVTVNWIYILQALWCESVFFVCTIRWFVRSSRQQQRLKRMKFDPGLIHNPQSSFDAIHPQTPPLPLADHLPSQHLHFDSICSSIFLPPAHTLSITDCSLSLLFT